MQCHQRKWGQSFGPQSMYVEPDKLSFLLVSHLGKCRLIQMSAELWQWELLLETLENMISLHFSRLQSSFSFHKRGLRTSSCPSKLCDQWFEHSHMLYFPHLNRNADIWETGDNFPQSCELCSTGVTHFASKIKASQQVILCVHTIVTQVDLTSFCSTCSVGQWYLLKKWVCNHQGCLVQQGCDLFFFQKTALVISERNRATPDLSHD